MNEYKITFRRYPHILSTMPKDMHNCLSVHGYPELVSSFDCIFLRDWLFYRIFFELRETHRPSWSGVVLIYIALCHNYVFVAILCRPGVCLYNKLSLSLSLSLRIRILVWIITVTHYLWDIWVSELHQLNASWDSITEIWT